ncbi:MAG: aminotransferase class V-fold PLP-dependent enzyme [Pseudobdellovibrio sp.]
MESKLKFFQSQFFKSDIVHLNNAGLQPICLPAKNKINYWAERFWQEGFLTDHDYMADVKNTRMQLSKLIKCLPEEIAFFTSTAGAINQVAFGIDLKPDDEVLMWDQEYSSHLYPWKAACDACGAKLILVESESDLSTPVENYKAAITDKTKVIAFSWVQFMNGARMSHLKELIQYAKSKDIFVFIDIMQGLGFHDFNLWDSGVDAIMGGSHKWLLAPVGVGFLAIRNSLTLKLKPRVIGAYTYGTCDDPSDFACEPKRDASKFEPGSKQVLEITALGAAIELILNVGTKTIENEALRLAQKLREGLSEKHYQVVSPFSQQEIHSTAFVNFTPTHSVSIGELSQKLNSHKILHAIRGPGIRLTTQAFNTDEQIDFVLSVL